MPPADTPETIETAAAAAGLSNDPEGRIAFQGSKGAYSDLACRTVYPFLETVPCRTFEDTFAAVRAGEARYAMIPIENSIAGRVADIHHLLPDAGLHIIGEHFQSIRHSLLAIPGTRLEDLKVVRSHVHALSQCREAIRELGLTAIVHADTAGSAAELAEKQDPTEAAIASTLAAETYGLEVLKEDLQDHEHNTTRFLIMAREARFPRPGETKTVTTFVFRVRSVPASLYKALGGFATNGVNLTKLESYMVGGRFHATQFYCDAEGHPEDQSMRYAFEELDFFAREVSILGVYPAHLFRLEPSQQHAHD